MFKTIKEYLEKSSIYKLNNLDRLIAIVKLIAEIPWGEGRTVKEVLKTKKVGTCTGKHLVLQACFDELGIEYRPVVCTFKWSEQEINYPENLKTIFKGGEWEHAHNFVQVKTKNRAYVDIDITWNSRLKPFGFKTFPQDWNCEDAFLGLDNIIRRWNGVDVKKKKKELINSLDPKLKKRREKFLKEFTKWVNLINSM